MSREITVEDTIVEDGSEIRDNLSDMGLAPAQIVVNVSYTDGSTATLSLGYNQPGTSYYYVQWSGDPGVYLCNSRSL